MNRPRRRPKLPARHSNNEKRRLMPKPTPNYIAQLQQKIRYEGSSKHKLHPHLYGLTPFQGSRGDATLCDRDASFGQSDYGSIEGMIHRGLEAGLVGENGVIWAIADNGWIYEGRMTNVGMTEYHGYPVRSTEPIAEMVCHRFSQWVQNCGDDSTREAVQRCKMRYGFR